MQNQTIASNYIGKVICKILGYSENSFVEQEMKVLKEYVNNRKYYEFNPILQDGSIGITLASKIIEDYKENQDKHMLNQIYNVFLSEIANLVTSGNYEQAIQKYSQMVLVIANYFEIIDLGNVMQPQYGKIMMLAS